MREHDDQLHGCSFSAIAVAAFAPHVCICACAHRQCVSLLPETIVSLESDCNGNGFGSSGSATVKPFC